MTAEGYVALDLSEWVFIPNDGKCEPLKETMEVTFNQSGLKVLDAKGLSKSGRDG